MGYPSANVDGLKDIIRLACTHKQKFIQYISTTGVFSSASPGLSCIDENSSIDNQVHYKAHGYTATKWVAEKVLMNAQSRGIHSNIYRLGLVSGDTEAGRSDSAQWFTRLLKICTTLGCGFEDNHTDWLPITPVDFVANSIVTLALSKHQDKVFHIGNPQSYRLSELIKQYNTISKKPLNIIPYKDFIALVKEQTTNKNALPFVPFIHGRLFDNDEFLTNSDPLIIESDKTITLLNYMGIALPSVDSALISRYFGYIDRS